jgi:oxygen-independent coproporphyrinogen-3 oxidase
MVENSAFSDFKTIAIEPTEQAAEYLMMGLRKSTGISQNRFASIGGAPLNANVINDLRDLDLIALDQDRLRATPKGIAVLNAVIRELLPDG